MFAEEGVNGAHQDPQYNVLYRNINMYRSFVDAAVAKHVMASVRMAQIDGAHNANATAVEAWNVMPELLVQHAINSAYSVSVGMPKEDICLSTVPPDAAPAPVHAHGPAVRGRAARLLRRVQDARPGEHAVHGGRRARRHREPRHEPRDQPAHQRRHPEHDHARRGPQRALALQQRRRREHGQAEPGRHGRPARDGQARPRRAGAQPEGARDQGAGLPVPGGDARGRRLLRRRRGGVLRRLRHLPRDPRRRHRAQERRRRGGGHDRASRRRLPRAGVPPLRREPPAGGLRRRGRRARAGRRREALRPHRRLHAVRRRQGAVHRRARPRGQRQRAARADGGAAREAPHQARGGVGGRRLGRGHACSCRRRRASRSSRRSSSARP